MGRGDATRSAAALPRSGEILFDTIERGLADASLYDDPNELHVFPDGWTVRRAGRRAAEDTELEHAYVQAFEMSLAEGVELPREETFIEILDAQGQPRIGISFHGEQPWVVRGLRTRSDDGSLTHFHGGDCDLFVEEILDHWDADEQAIVPCDLTAEQHLRDYLLERETQLERPLRFMPGYVRLAPAELVERKPRSLLTLADLHKQNPRGFIDGYEPRLNLRFEPRTVQLEHTPSARALSRRDRLHELAEQAVCSFLTSELQTQIGHFHPNEAEAVGQSLYLLAVLEEIKLPLLIDQLDAALTDATLDVGWLGTEHEVDQVVEQHLEEEGLTEADDRYAAREEALRQEARDALRDEEDALARRITQYLYDLNELYQGSRASLANPLPSMSEAAALRLEQDRGRGEQPNLD